MKSKSLLLCFFLIGCGTVKVSDCGKADWKIVGRIDEELARANAMKKRHKDICKNKFNEAQWDEGRQIGAFFACSESGAYWVGKKSLAFPSHCPSETHQKLNVAYQEGRAVAQWQNDVQDLESELTEAKAAEKKKAEQKSSWSQDLGRYLFNGDPRSKTLESSIEDKREKIRAMESKYTPPYAEEYP